MGHPGATLHSAGSGTRRRFLGFFRPGERLPHVCRKDTDSLQASLSATAITAGFAGPISPGAHCVGLRQNGELVAFLAGSISVTPSLEKAIDVSGGVLRLPFRSTVPNAGMLIAIGAALPQPVVIPGVLYTLQVNPVLINSFVTDAQGRYVVAINLSTLPPMVSASVQGVEYSLAFPWRFTNPVAVTVP